MGIFWEKVIAKGEKPLRAHGSGWGSQRSKRGYELPDCEIEGLLRRAIAGIEKRSRRFLPVFLTSRTVADDEVTEGAAPRDVVCVVLVVNALEASYSGG
jgi:hypothetical protein